MNYLNIYLLKLKFIIDEIEKVFSILYGFTEEELDFILNSDIKYRIENKLNNGRIMGVKKNL